MASGILTSEGKAEVLIALYIGTGYIVSHIVNVVFFQCWILLELMGLLLEQDGNMLQ